MAGCSSRAPGWGQGLRGQVHREGKLDFAFEGRGTARPSQKSRAFVRRDPRAGAFRAPNEKEKLGLISQAGRVIAGITTKAVLTPQQPVVPGQASLQALMIASLWTPSPGQESFPGFMQMNGDYSGLGVQARVAMTKTILVTFNIKAKKGDTFFLTIGPNTGSWEQGRMLTADEGVQTLSCTYTPSEPGVYVFYLPPQDNFTWFFYSAEISVEK